MLSFLSAFLDLLLPLTKINDIFDGEVKRTMNSVTIDDPDAPSIFPNQYLNVVAIEQIAFPEFPCLLRNAEMVMRLVMDAAAKFCDQNKRHHIFVFVLSGRSARKTSR